MRAIVSVSDKTGATNFAQSLSQLGFEIFSTGGTKKALGEAKVPVKGVSEITGFPEILNGRVRPCTLLYMVDFWLGAICQPI